MRILCLGGDERQLAIIKDLSKRHMIDAIGYDKIKLDDSVKNIKLEDINLSLYDVIILPVSGIADDYSIKTPFGVDKIYLTPDFLCNVRQDTLVFTGVLTKSLDEMLKVCHKWVIPLMEDKEIKKENSIPTVEGIIGDLIFNTPNTINGSKVLVLGYGNVGKLLTDKLTKLDAKVSVGVILKEDLEELVANDINAFYTTDEDSFNRAVRENEIIINTVPVLLLDKKHLDLVSEDTYILDISSQPYGVDFSYAKEKCIKHKLFNAIPAVVAPKSSGMLLSKRINKAIGGE